MAGIVGYGAHLPRHRIKVEEIAKVWGADAPSYKKGLMLSEKSVPPTDMDTIFHPEEVRFDPGMEYNRPIFTRRGPELSAMGSKTSREWLYAWIRNPISYHPETRMPGLRPCCLAHWRTLIRLTRPSADRLAAPVTCPADSLRSE